MYGEGMFLCQLLMNVYSVHHNELIAMASH